MRKPDRGLVVFAIEVVKPDGAKVAETEWSVMMKRKPDAAGAAGSTLGTV